MYNPAYTCVLTECQVVEHRERNFRRGNSGRKTNESFSRFFCTYIYECLTNNGNDKGKIGYD